MSKTDTRTVVKAGVWYTIVNFISKGAIFLTTPIFTRLMSTNDIGGFANITSWFQILVPLITFDMYVSLSIARFDYKDELDTYISSTLICGSVFTGIAYGIVLLNMKFFCTFFSMNEYAVHVIFIYMLVYPALQMLQQKNLFLYKYKLSALVTLLSLVLSVGCALILTVSYKDKLLGRTIGYFVPLIIINAVIYLYFLAKGNGVSLKYIKYAVSISFPMIWHAMATQVLSAGDRIVITNRIGEEANAMYSVAYTCSMVVTVLWSSMNSAWSPWTIERMNAGNTEEIKKASRPYILFFAVIVVFMMLISPELLWIMGGNSYMEAKDCLPPVMVGLVCQFVYSLYINAEFYLKKQNRIAIGTVIAAVINILLNLVFVQRYGYVAAAYTTLIGYILLLLFHYLSLKKLGKGDWYDNYFNWLIVLVFILLIPLFLFLYRYTVLRYVVILLVVILISVVGYSKRIMLIGIIKSIIHK